MYKLGESSGPWRYAGRHGWVTEEEFHELGQSNQLKLGSGAWNTAIQGLQRDTLALYKQLPDEWEENIERTAGQVAENVGNAYNSLPEGVKEQVQKVKTGFIDIPAQAIQNLSDVHGHIGGHEYGGLHPGPLEFALEAAHTAATSGGSQVRRLKHIEDLAQITNNLSINRKYFANPLPDKRRLKRVVEIGKDVATKPAAKAASRTNGNGKLKNGTKVDVLPDGTENGHTNGNGNGIKNDNPSTPVNILEMRRGAVETLNKGETDLLEQIKELQAKQPKPGSPEARLIRKLNEKAGQYRRSKAAIIQTLYDDDMVMEMYNNILSAKGLSKAQIDFFNRLKTPLSLKGYNTPVHHRAWLQSIAQPFYNMDLAKGLETQKILVDKHGRHLGDATPNFTTILDKSSHDVAHFGNTADTRFREQFAKLDLNKMSAEEIADNVERISQKMDMQTGVGITSKANTQKGLDLLETLPKDFLRQLSPDFNVLDSLSPDWDKFRAWIQNLHPDFKPLLNPQSQAQVESIQLQSMNIA